jgi:hypothetical protein
VHIDGSLLRLSEEHAYLVALGFECCAMVGAPACVGDGVVTLQREFAYALIRRAPDRVHRGITRRLNGGDAIVARDRSCVCTREVQFERSDPVLHLLVNSLAFALDVDVVCARRRLTATRRLSIFVGATAVVATMDVRLGVALVQLTTIARRLRVRMVEFGDAVVEGSVVARSKLQ